MKGDFLRVARGHQHAKSRTGIDGTLNRCALLCSLMAKVELRMADQTTSARCKSRGLGSWLRPNVSAPRP